MVLCICMLQNILRQFNLLFDYNLSDGIQVYTQHV